MNVDVIDRTDIGHVLIFRIFVQEIIVIRPHAAFIAVEISECHIDIKRSGFLFEADK